MDKTIKVLIVDDHAIVRQGLKKLLATEEDLLVVGEASDGKEALDMTRASRPDVVILDVAMPNLGGLETIPNLLKIHPDVKIVILSMYGKESFAQEALRFGAHGYVLKGDSGEVLVRAVRSVMKGAHFFSKQIEQSLMTAYIQGVRRPDLAEKAVYESLSDREKQVFHLMMKGQSTVEISKNLGISPKTGEKHRTSIVKKLGISNPVDLVKFAIRIGIIDPDTFDV